MKRKRVFSLWINLTRTIHEMCEVKKVMAG